VESARNKADPASPDGRTTAAQFLTDAACARPPIALAARSPPSLASSQKNRLVKRLTELGYDVQLSPCPRKKDHVVSL
jgi:hypothetical protein